MFFFISCSKDEITTPVQSSTNQNQSTTLVADHWVASGEGKFQNTFYGAMKDADGAKVYLVLNDIDLQVNSSNIIFMGGSLGAVTEGDDLVVHYHAFNPDRGLPFDKLIFKVVK